MTPIPENISAGNVTSVFSMTLIPVDISGRGQKAGLAQLNLNQILTKSERDLNISNFQKSAFRLAKLI